MDVKPGMRTIFYSAHLERTYHASLEDDGYCGSHSFLDHRCQYDPGHGGYHQNHLPGNILYRWETNPLRRKIRP